VAYLEKGIQDRERLLGQSYKLGIFERLFGKIEKNSIFRNKIAMWSVISYCILGACFTMFDEAFPLFALAETSSGGLSASSKDIGIIGAMNGISAVILQLVIFYPLATRLGFVRLYRLGLAMGALAFFNFPSLHFFLGNKVLLWAGLAVSTFIKVCVGQFAFSSASAIISNSCPLTQVGAINGFAQSLVAFPRAFSPALAGNLLAWGFSNGIGFPFNQYLIFIAISVFMATSLLITFRLPRTLDYPYEPPVTTTTATTTTTSTTTTADGAGGEEESETEAKMGEKEERRVEVTFSVE